MDKAVQTSEIMPPLPKQFVADNATQTDGVWSQTIWRLIHRPDVLAQTTTSTVQTVPIHVQLAKVAMISVMSQTTESYLPYYEIKQPPAKPTHSITPPKEVYFPFQKKIVHQNQKLGNSSKKVKKQGTKANMKKKEN